MKKKAFSLIELIIVLAIMSLFLSITFLKSGAYFKIKEKKEAQNLLADINYCRQKSLSSTYDYKIEFVGNNYKIKKYGGYLVKDVDLYFLKAVSTYELRFKSTGPVVNAQTIKFISDNREYKIYISPIGGRIRIDE